MAVRRPCIAFVTGGYDKEAAVNYQSVKTYQAELDREKFNIYTIDIRPDGWYHTLDDGSVLSVNKADFTLNTGEKVIFFDAIIIGISGTPGEDGKLQAYFDLLRIPYTGCSAATSTVTFNKHFAVALAAFNGIPVAKSCHVIRGDSVDVESICSRLQLPIFVKPCNGGSSIGMSKVLRKDDLRVALERAFVEGDQVLVEEFISGREFTVGVWRRDGRIVVLPITEIIPQNDFFDYEAKYQGKSREDTPACVEDSIAEKLRDTAARVYSVFECCGVVRIDFIYNEERSEPFMLEVNTVPGQTAASILPQQIRAHGWTLKEFYTGLLEEALLNRK